jgi:hypothetical protein
MPRQNSSFAADSRFELSLNRQLPGSLATFTQEAPVSVFQLMD